MFAEEISEDFSEDRKYHFHWILVDFWISSKSSRKIAFFWEVFGSFTLWVFTLKPFPALFFSFSAIAVFFVPSDKVAENAAIAGKIKKNQKIQQCAY